MNFMEAVKAMRDGKVCRCLGEFYNHGMFCVDTNPKSPYFGCFLYRSDDALNWPDQDSAWAYVQLSSEEMIEEWCVVEARK